MAAQETSFRSSKSLAATALAGLGVVVLCQGMDELLYQLSPMVTCASGDLLGLLPTIVLAARSLPAPVCDNSCVFQHLTGILAATWPLLCAMIGA
jgi:hypothetical protein